MYATIGFETNFNENKSNKDKIVTTKFVYRSSDSKCDKPYLILHFSSPELKDNIKILNLEERKIENLVIEEFEKYAKEINKIFGYDITSKVIDIYKDNANIKKKGSDKEVEKNLDILFIFRSLLIETIDCDRMEYIMTDRYMTWGEKIDFTDIFSYITIVLLNDNPTVGFERGAISTIENMLLTRFDQYDDIYYDPDATLIEMTLKKYKKEAKWADEYVTSAMEFEMLSEVRTTLLKGEKGSVLYRLAQIILEGKEIIYSLRNSKMINNMNTF